MLPLQASVENSLAGLVKRLHKARVVLKSRFDQLAESAPHVHDGVNKVGRLLEKKGERSVRPAII